MLSLLTIGWYAILVSRLDVPYPQNVFGDNLPTPSS